MNLVLSQTFDVAGSRRWRCCGKLWMASLLRGLWDGELRLIRNFEQALFPTGRMGLIEVQKPDFDHHHRLLGWRREAEMGYELSKAGLQDDRWKRQVAKEAARMLLFEEIAKLERPERYEWVLLADADCVALRNLDHLFDRDEEILVSPLGEGNGRLPDPGFVAVRGRLVKDFAGLWRAARETRKDWENSHGVDLAAALAKGGWRVGRFERGEVFRADASGVTIAELNDAAVVHFGGLEPKNKQRLGFAFQMMTVYGDEDGLFLDMLES